MKIPIFNRIIALVLSVLTVFYLLPASVYADIGSNATTVEATVNTNDATMNPFKYRGYYYDTDLGLYYLQFQILRFTDG